MAGRARGLCRCAGQPNRWTDGWMNGRTHETRCHCHGCQDRMTDWPAPEGGVDRRTDGPIDRPTDGRPPIGQTDGQRDRQTVARAEERADKRMDRWMDKPTDGQKENHKMELQGRNSCRHLSCTAADSHHARNLQIPAVERCGNIKSGAAIWRRVVDRFCLRSWKQSLVVRRPARKRRLDRARVSRVTEPGLAICHHAKKLRTAPKVGPTWHAE
jgi:hypothetical protein